MTKIPPRFLFGGLRGPVFRVGRRRGFALIATISLLVLLTIVAVGLLSLSAISLRTSRSDALSMAARANARMSLLVAIGELQRLAGPDRRVTATGSILEGSKAGGEVRRPHLTGVWKSWKWDGSGSPGYDKHKHDDFLGWLVSMRGTNAAGDLDMVRSAPDTRSIKLVGSGTVPDPAEEVAAVLVDIDTGGATKGGFAWVVFDEGVKARGSLPDFQPDSLGEQLAELATAPVPGFGMVDGGIDWAELGNAGAERTKFVTSGEFGLAGLDLRSRAFHDLGAYSSGLAVNVAEGGLARDLSLLFDKPTLPSSLARKFLYSDKSRPLVMPPSRFKGANAMPSPDSSWRLLHSWARLWEKVRDPAGTPTLRASVNERPRPGTSPTRVFSHPHFTHAQIAPVIANAQFIFSLSFGNHGTLSRYKRNGKASSNDRYITWLVIDPVITLWNPYNVNLRFSEGRIELHRVPLAFRLYKNGRTVNRPYTIMANTYTRSNFSNRAKKFYRLNIKPKTGKREIVMKPGEFLVFTAHNHVKHYRHEYWQKGVDLRPGWNPPAGNRSNRYVGGISTMNLCVDSRGADSGRNNGKTVRTPPVKPGDRINVEVVPARAGADKLAETGNDEVTSYLKYYIRGTGSTPSFVGAIEFDYGEKEDEMLESFSKRDLPTIVVPSSITSDKADDYVGSKPPPAVRFKEPFLIASLHLKTQRDSRWPARAWLQNNPTNLYASTGLDQREDFTFHQYEFSWERMLDWNSTPTVEIDPKDRGYGASGLYRQTGQSYAVFSSVPLAPLVSLGQLRHAPVNSGGQLPLQTQVVANSFANPLIDARKIRMDNGDRTFLDHSFLANNALFDRWFFSSASSRDSRIFDKEKSATKVLREFLAGQAPLPNRRMRPIIEPDSEADSTATELTGDDGYKHIAAHLMIDGAFNVNSTSVAAWRALLASLQPDNPPALDPESGRIDGAYDGDVLASRHIPPSGKALESTQDPLAREALTWAGHRRLDKKQIDDLARALVEEVKKRGPFQSLAEFVNRRVESGNLGVEGAVQAAIDASGINARVRAAGKPAGVPAGIPDPAAAAGTTTDGAPGSINQADLLTPLAPQLAARSDTFVIRAYGEARRGDEIARAWCEAVVQRVPRHVNPAVAADADPAAIEADSLTKRFGRRFEVVLFRWLSAKEI